MEERDNTLTVAIMQSLDDSEDFQALLEGKIQAAMDAETFTDEYDPEDLAFELKEALTWVANVAVKKVNWNKVAKLYSQEDAA